MLCFRYEAARFLVIEAKAAVDILKERGKSISI